ncbi:hypothetical protein MMC13_005807 [Lambiella insularis]|nr:hypothetical protein [Lambiella insularis]
MAPLVVARSLAALTALAANPPHHPRNPISDIQEPLVLYIARIPGGRDVFLTTMKPQQRVVTAQDIASSLYYFHLETHEDEVMREAMSQEQDLQRVRTEDNRNLRRTNSGHSPKRKALLSTPLLTSENRPEPPSKVYPHFQAPRSHESVYATVQRTSIGDTNDTISSIRDIAPQLPRKPIGPRPMSLDVLTMPINSSSKGMCEGRQPSEQPSVVPSRSASMARECRSDAFDISAVRNPHLTVGKLGEAIYMGQFTESPITVIRRDPSSGAQWNVGKITNGVASSLPNSYLHPSIGQLPQTERQLLLEITSEGYSKFVKSTANMSTSPLADHHILPASEHEPIADHSLISAHFRRQLFLEKPRSQAICASPRRSEFGSSSRSVRGNDSPLSLPDLSSDNYNRLSPPTTSYTGPYTFQSPWNGTCAFSTGITGRSLKCKHTLHLPQASNGSRVSSTAPVSELRFNLPNSKLFAHLSPRRPPLVSGSTKRSSFPTGSHVYSGTNMAPTDDAEDSDSEGSERMDLSLGQEDAGGGMRGKQAKLGKLIVEDEGLKMLDLIVMANMGIWWSVYGKEWG